MDIIDIMYFISNNMTSIIAIVLLIYYWSWQAASRNAELKIEEERIVEYKQKEEFLSKAMEKVQRESIQFRETEKQLQRIIDRIQQENKELRANHREVFNEINEERRRRIQNREEERNRREAELQLRRNDNRNNNDHDDILQYINIASNLIGTIAMGIVVGRVLR